MTKTQFANFEPGEFAEQKPRTKDEVFEMIEAFPWEKQREHIQIGLTNPGVVIETETPTWLKLALYYNGKFVLYFFDGINLYSKSFTVYGKAYPFIAEYFDKGYIELSEFKKENLLFKHVGEHFVSKDFRYFVDGKRVKAFLVHTSAINFFMFLFYLCVGIIALFEKPFHAAIFAFMTLMLILSIINVLLFLNYYRFMKNKMLILSKGNEYFWYGDCNNLMQYCKEGITSVAIISSKRPSSSKSGFWSEFAVYKIYFNNNQQPIAFTSLLINKGDFKNKFSRRIQTEIPKTFPFFTDLELE